MSYTTSRRMFLLSTPLGEDTLLIKEFEGHERLSHSFEFRLEVLSERDDIEAADLVGKRVSLRIETDHDERHWAGIVASFERIGRHSDAGAGDAELTLYTCLVVPWWWLMTLHEDSRIFQNLNIPDIIQSILGEFELRDYQLHLSGTYPELVYCTQYCESNFNFMSRLLERAGIHYYVKYSGEVETLVFTDNNDDHPKMDEDLVRFAQVRATEEDDTIVSLVRRQHLRSGRVVMRDYNFEKPDDLLEASVDSLVRIGDNANYERFTYPGGYLERSEGDTVARVQMEGEEAEHEILDGSGNVRALVPGYRFTLEGHTQEALNQEYLVLSVSHRGSNNIGGDGESSSYSNQFSVIPQRVPFRQPRRTPRSTIHGPQTALVVGPPGDEIHTDKYGRIKVHFFWDRLSQRNDKSSCWVRVAQSHAGAGWGSFMLPRVGEEVLVAFEHGDPDRPIIVGSLYNAKNMPPYELPANATRSTIKTLSKGGGGFNEIRFEDAAGSEELFLHAQKDMQVRVLNSHSASIGANASLTVGKDSSEMVGEERHLVVGKNQFTDISENLALNVGAATSVAVGSDMHLLVGSEARLDAGTEVHLKAGMKIVLEAGMQISLKAGSSSITLGPAGVTIDGPLVKVNCGGSPLAASKAERPDKAKKAKEAIKDKAGRVSNPGQQAQARALRNAAAQAQPYCAECAAKAQRAGLA